ncbi:hypothetical protein F5Y05DRAFT_392553, partial [Hypoxylon sp. FL0543]
MEHLVGIPRDQRVARPSYDRVPQSAPFSHREDWSGYSQPIDSHPVSGGYGGVPRMSNRNPTNRSQYHQLSLAALQPDHRMRTDDWQRRVHRPFRPMSESSLDAPSNRRGSWRGHEDSARFIDESVWGEAPEWQGPVTAKHRRISHGAHWDPDAAASEKMHGDVRRSNHHTRKHCHRVLSGVREIHSEGRSQSSHKDNHHTPVPPKAPKIPRLPTPDLDADEYDERDMTSHQFCACCNAVGSTETKSKRRECTVGKMERQCTLFPIHQSWPVACSGVCADKSQYTRRRRISRARIHVLA